MSHWEVSLIGSLLVAAVLISASPQGKVAPTKQAPPVVEEVSYGLTGVFGFKWGTPSEAIETVLSKKWTLAEKKGNAAAYTGEFEGINGCRLIVTYNEDGRLFRLALVTPVREGTTLATHFEELVKRLDRNLHTAGTWEYYEMQPKLINEPVTPANATSYADRVNKGPGYFAGTWILANSLVLLTSSAPDEISTTPTLLLSSEWFQLEPGGKYVPLADLF